MGVLLLVRQLFSYRTFVLNFVCLACQWKHLNIWVE